MYTIQTQKGSNLTLLLAIIMLLAGSRFFSPLFMTSQEEAVAYLPLLLVLYGTLLFGSLFLLIRLVKTRKHKLILHENSMTYMPLFGAPKLLSYHDLQKVSIGGKMYIIYTRNGKKLVTFSDFHMENAREVVAFLKAKGVRTEI